MFDMIWYDLIWFRPVWLCLNTSSILFGVPSCGQGYYMGHLSRSGALVLRGIGLTAGIALKKWRKKGEIETQTRWDTQILIDLTVSQCLASIPSTNVPTKKQVHREKIRTYWILLNLKNSVTQHLLTSAWDCGLVLLTGQRLDSRLRSVESIGLDTQCPCGRLQSVQRCVVDSAVSPVSLDTFRSFLLKFCRT